MTEHPTPQELEIARAVLHMAAQPPDHVRAWAIALSVNIRYCDNSWQYRATDAIAWWEDVPDCDSGDYFKVMVLAAEHMRIEKLPHGYSAHWDKGDLCGQDEGADQISALIAAVLASKGGGR